MPMKPITFHAAAQAQADAFHAPQPAAEKAGCASCALHQLCLPTGLDLADRERLADIIVRRRRVARNDSLFRMGDRFQYLYAVHSGCFKTQQVCIDGAGQITGFSMTGELLGMEAIASGRHHCYALALEDSEVCEIPFVQLESLFAQMPALLQRFHRLMSGEITRDQHKLLLLGNMRADQRFAAFLVNLSTRYAARGHAADHYQLPMAREDIASYLALTIESISRLISKFKRLGLIEVKGRQVTLLDLPRLQALAALSASSSNTKAGTRQSEELDSDQTQDTGTGDTILSIRT